MPRKEIKQKIVEEYKAHEKDTGSSEVQIALLTERIKELILHLKKNPKDFSSKRGLLKIVAQRKRLLDFLKNEDKKSHDEMLKKLDLK